MSDVVIIGAGAIGLLTARELSAEGLGVTLIERGACAGESSWAGGGIVSPLYPWRYSDAVTALALQAQHSYPTLCASLLEETGIDPEFEPCGLLMLEAEDAAEAMHWARRSRRSMQKAERKVIYELEPRLSEDFSRGLWMPDVANVRNPRLCRALQQSLTRIPQVKLLEHTQVEGFEHDGDCIRAVQVRGPNGSARIAAGQVVVCAGAWSGTLLRDLSLELPVEPVKGQMLLYEMEAPQLRCMILHKGRYLIPRRDGRLLVGSTLEHQGFDKHPSNSALESLRESAARMLPMLEGLPVKQQWAGLRPGAPGGIPFIGALPGFRNLFVNAGHYRNGLVLAPASARLLADLVIGRAASLDPAPYAPVRRIQADRPG